ncbi:TetR/AcrR family transcriptional regulator [Nocardioides sp. zg-DK7169]|uniref:TetR/AcrR family transcriptional regulator n=1 Tax=Nocardioides sp. zg-DK7169 TaxID=2736600 RepID=UPI001558090D|nr:TetR/AcrR family transcriptional regulator [Nocardioides sp. zg-DK7169]NPC97009.1 TetR/AcrR family transcriptional regulator [Nocardioides sp. zg-DK7169]
MSTSPDTRTQVLDAFAAQLATLGYAGVSLSAVAREAGIQKPSLYHHFPQGKESLYEAVALRFVDDMEARIRAAVGSGGLEDRLRALGAVSAAHAATNGVSFEQRVYDALAQVGEQTRDRVSRRYVGGVLDPVTEVFAAAVADGELTGEPAFLMNAFLHLMRATDLAAGADEPARLVALFLDGARPR